MRTVLCCLLIFLGAGPSVAAITPEALRALAYSGDVDAVEQAFGDAHEETLEGTLAYNDLRNMVVTLSVSHPDIIDFVETWLTTYPESPYAKSVWVFQMHSVAGRVRGSDVARDTHPEALQMFRQMQRRGMEVALEAYHTAPDYVPASDAVFLHNMTTKMLSTDRHFDILTEVMQVTPNRGSLGRALMLATPQWGGRGYGAIIDLCDMFADKVPAEENYTAEVCTVDMIHYYPNSAAAKAYSYRLLDEVDHPRLLKARAMRVIDEMRHDETDVVLEYLSQPDVRDVDAAINFQRMFRNDATSANVLALFDEKLQAFGRQGMLHDPYDTEVLDIVSRANGFWLSGRYSFDENEQSIIARRRAVGAPFDARAWDEAALHRPTYADPEQSLVASISDSDAYYINAIHYGDHHRYYLLRMLANKVRSATGIRWWVSQDRPNPITDDVFETELLCPIMRLNRLVAAQCELEGLDEQHCYEYPGLAGEIDSMIADARAKGVCDTELNAPLDTLLYEPVAVGFSGLDAGIANRP